MKLKKLKPMLLLVKCKDLNFIDSFDSSYMNIYISLWENLHHKTEKHIGLLEYKNYSTDIKNKLGEDYYKHMMSFLFKKKQ